MNLYGEGGFNMNIACIDICNFRKLEEYVIIHEIYKTKKEVLEYFKECFGEIENWQENKVNNIIFDKPLVF